jgi:hypothetical protein
MYYFETLSNVTEQSMGAVGIPGAHYESIRTCFQSLDYFTLNAAKARKAFESS